MPVSRDRDDRFPGRSSPYDGSIHGRAGELRAATDGADMLTAGSTWLRTGSAASGLLLVLFLLLHLAGVALAPLAPDRFEAYAAALHRSPWLPAAELALLAVALLHLALSLARWWTNRHAAGNGATLRSRRAGPLAPLAAWAAWAQAAGGLVLLAFLAQHLAQLRWPRPSAGTELAALGAVLASPWSLVLYLAAALALALHLFHGGEAAHRSLGWLQPANASAIRAAARLLAVLVGGGFLAVTLALALPALALAGGTP
jgi:succinate dehydrogenase / fumarate reductase cytochrome b subunit